MFQRMKNRHDMRRGTRYFVGVLLLLKFAIVAGRFPYGFQVHQRNVQVQFLYAGQKVDSGRAGPFYSP